MEHSPNGCRGCLLPLLILGVAFYLVVQSTNYQVRHDPACYGSLSAGWPMTFLCDDTFGSPTSSWGKIDEADWWNGPNLVGLFGDFLFYAVLLSILWLIVLGVSRLVRQRRQAPS